MTQFHQSQVYCDRRSGSEYQKILAPTCHYLTEVMVYVPVDTFEFLSARIIKQ